jgi:hypothetical protein
LIELHERDPQADYTGLMKTLALRMLNSVEMCAQEGAWFLLRQPMSWASRATVAIPTMIPHERHRARKRKIVMDAEGIGPEATDIWTKNIIEKYEERPESLEAVTLAQYVAWYDMRSSTHGTGGDDGQVVEGEDRDLDTHSTAADGADANADADDGEAAAD